ncbi:MAG TPA: efflux RND transporter permease subunit [Candidatus Binatia bacterium]|nr:efflux RND transporter permease subunit [Candidatus Binatia bacterium]
MSLADICIRRPVFATMLIAALVVLGIFSYRGLGVDLYPNVDIPTVTVTATLKGSSVEEMETAVTKPIEDAISTIDGIDELRAVIKDGISVITVQFILEKSADVAAQEVRDKVSTILSQLPTGTDPPVIQKFQVDAMPVMKIAVSGKRNLRELSEIARKQIKEDIESLRGVGQVIMVGRQERAVTIDVDPDRLAAYNLSIAQVKRAVQAENVEVPGGRVDQGRRELVLRTMGRMPTAADFNDLIVGNFQGRPILIRDIGTAENGVVEQRSLARLDGENAVQLIVRKQSGTNTVEVVDRVKARLQQLRGVLPQDIRSEVIVDQSRFIKASYDEVKMHLILGALLVAFTVFLFMHDWRSTIIASVAIPASIIATFTLMRIMGFTLNNITMLGLILSVGIVIDDAVVVLENIFRHVEERGETPRSAASKATREIALAVMATTLSLIVIFVPLAFMAGRVGRFFSSFGSTVAFSVAVSLLISFTLTPMLSSRFLKIKHDSKSSKESRFYSWIDTSYGWILRWSLRYRWVVIAAGIFTVFWIMPLFSAIGKNFIPTDDQSEFEIIIQTPGGYTLAETDKLMRELEGRIGKLRGVTNILTTIGDTTGNIKSGQGDVTIADIYVRLIDLSQRDYTQFEVMADARRMLQEYPDLRTSVQGVNSFSGGGVRQTDLEFNLRGPSLEKLQEYTDKLIARMREIPGLVDIDTTLSVRTPELRTLVDRKKASEFGIQIEDIADTLQTFVGGEPISKYKEEDEEYDVWLRAVKSKRDDQQALMNLTVPGKNGQLVRIANLVDLKEDLGPSEIDRYNRQRKVTIVANLLPTLPLGEAVQKINGYVRELDLPANYTADFTGRAKVLAETGLNFMYAFGLSFIFMYMVLAAQFESFLHPITILLALPLTIPFALLSLILLRQPMDIYAMFGLFMLFGIVKKNGILQIDYTNTLRAQGMERDQAILEANHARLRPILMTTLMLIFGMLPMALGRGPGAASRASMAKVIIGGQALSLLITLLITPVAYSLFDDLGRLGRVAGAKEKIAAWRGALWEKAAGIYQRGNGRSRRS